MAFHGDISTLELFFKKLHQSVTKMSPKSVTKFLFFFDILHWQNFKSGFLEFLHGTTTGSRIIKVDGIEILKHDWMFRLVGEGKWV